LIVLVGLETVGMSDTYTVGANYENILRHACMHIYTNMYDVHRWSLRITTKTCPHIFQETL